MASFAKGEVSTTYFYINVYPDSAYSWYRVYARTTGGTVVHDQWYNSTSPFAVQIYNLSPGTTYVVNVGCGTGYGSSVTWIGAQNISTQTEVQQYYATVAYDANGGSGAPPNQTVYGTSTSLLVTLYSTVPTRDGYTFAGWSTSSAATSAQYLPGYSYYFGAGVTYLYAVWTSNGGGGDTSGDGYVYIMGGDGIWHKAVPYVMGGDGVWHKTAPYVMGGDGVWHKTGG